MYRNVVCPRTVLVVVRNDKMSWKRLKSIGSRILCGMEGKGCHQFERFQALRELKLMLSFRVKLLWEREFSVVDST